MVLKYLLGKSVQFKIKSYVVTADGKCIEDVIKLDQVIDSFIILAQKSKLNYCYYYSIMKIDQKKDVKRSFLDKENIINRNHLINILIR